MSTTIVLERYIIEFLREKISALQESRSLEKELNEIFAGFPLSDRTRLLEFFRKKTIRVRETWPENHEAEFPCFVVSPQSTGDHPERTLIGDILLPNVVNVLQYDDDGLPIKGERIETYGKDIMIGVDIETWTWNGELTPLLNEFAKYAIFKEQGQFESYGANRIKIRQGKFKPGDSDIYPNVPYVIITTVEIEGEWGYTQKVTDIGFRNNTEVEEATVLDTTE